MPLVEVVTIELGAAIAKSIFKFWLKDSALGENISSNLIDLLKEKTSDIFAQREGERQFAKIGDKIAENVLPLFEKEGANLDEGDQIAVAREVAKAFNGSKLSSDILTRLNLEPTQLAQYIQTSHSTATNLFSEAATSLYLRIIKEACTYIVNIASQLPSFTEHSFAEVLKREDQIIAIAKEALEELLKIRKQLDPTVEAERFEIDYREAIVRHLDVLHLIGAEVSLTNRRHRLSVAYITLSVEQVLSHPSSPFFEDTTDDKIQQIVTVDTALAYSGHLLIRGLPGSGKTTLLQWVAVKAASRSFEGQLANWNGLLPFYIQLRRCTKSGLPAPQNFPGLISPAIAGTMPDGWVHTILKSGRAIVLVDGVDEVPESQREEVYIWLHDLKESFPKARFIITSRPYAVKEDERWNQEGWSIADLQPMELASIYEFVEHWHEAVRQELRTDDEKNELTPLAEHLKERIRQIRALHTLAANPLLCAMLCALNRERRRKLPVNRIELYEACCSLLLYRREQESHISLPEYPDLDYGQKRRLLDDLAYWMIKEKLSETEVVIVDERFEQQLAHMPNILRGVSGSKMRKYFVERSGIIREPVEGMVDFVHRTFQEFFAAKAALDSMEVMILITNAHIEQWQEVIILAAGLASKTMCEQLVSGLISRGDNEKNYSSQLYLLAISCLETAIQLGPEVKAEVEKRLNQLIPPKTITEAKAIASAGEAAVKYLDRKRFSKRGKSSSTITAACIRCLAFIGGETALNVLEEYTYDTRDNVVDALVKVWDAFDNKEAYAKRIFSRMSDNISSLLISRITSLAGINYLKNLRSLDLSNCTYLTDLSPLVGLNKLEYLSMYYCSQVKDLSPLESLTSLTKLQIFGNRTLTDISPLSKLPNLTSLELPYCWGLTDISPLSKLPNLTSLELTSCWEITDLSPLSKLPNLTSLKLSGTWKLADLSPLVKLPNLTTLILLDNKRPIDLSPLAELPNLATLELTEEDNFIGLEVIRNLPNLSIKRRPAYLI